MKISVKSILQTVSFTITAAAVLLAAASCKKNNGEESYLGSMTVTLLVPEGFDDMTFGDLNVTVLNTGDGVQKTLPGGEDGVVPFEDLTAGTYNISVDGKWGEIAMSGVKNGVLVESQKKAETEVQLVVAGSASGLLIKELFYSGTSSLYDGYLVTMYKDFFFELFNNSGETIYLDGLYLANIWGPATYIPTSDLTLPMLEDTSLDQDYVYADAVIRIPGNGTDYPLEPGKSFLIATNAINFREEVRRAAEEWGETVTEDQLAHIVDLSTADLETYAVTWMQGKGYNGNDYFDIDNPDVTNADNIYMNPLGMEFFMPETTGTAMVIFRSDRELTDNDIYTYSYFYPSDGNPSEISLMKVPVESVLDGVENLNNREAARWKRLPQVIDLGFGYIPNDDGTLTNFSQRRKVDAAATEAAGRLVLQDTNNSTNDFDPVNPPEPKGGYPGYDIK